MRAMETKVKTARFRQIVAECGRPEVLTLWVAPEQDKAFQAALRGHKLVTVTPREHAKEKALVGYHPGPGITLLVFPHSVRAYEGRPIVGLDFSLLAEPPPPKAPTFKPGKAQPKAKPQAAPKAPPVASEKPAPAKPPRRAKPPPPPKPPLEAGMAAALAEARQGLAEGGIPIGAALVRDGKIVGRGRNQRVQQDDPVTHAETDCLRNAGRLGSYRGCTLYSTLMPCYFCAGAAVQFGIKRVVVGESRNFPGAPQFLRAHGIEVVNLDLPECHEMFAKWLRENPRLWQEDIGA